MQKRTLYLSLLLVSCLLFFGFSYASAQSVTFQSKTVARCTDATVNITVANPGELSAFELVFEVTGDYSSIDVDFAPGFTGLNNRIGPIVDGNVYRMAAMKADAGDVCLDATGGVVVGQITLHTADVCDGTIEIVGATVNGGCCDAVSASTGLVSCALEALATTITPGTVTIVNQAPTIACPGDMTVHWGDVVAFDVTFDDPDMANGCENLTFDVIEGPGSVDGNGHYMWATGGDDVCDHLVTIEVRDKCGVTAECSLNICVENTPPEITYDPADTICVAWTATLTGAVDADDPDGGPNALNYSLVSFDGPTDFGGGLTIDAGTGEWTWEIGDDPDYLGTFELCIKVSDGANVCSPCSPENADTACYAIHVVGFPITIEKIHHQHQGQNTTVSVSLDSAYSPASYCCDLIGGFDFLIAYDVPGLTSTGAEPGALIDNDKFEYFTYRFGANGNCDGGCPSGLIRVVGMRETNNGVTNDYHITTPGELVKLNFYVTNDYNYEGQFLPIRFYWLDCGDNTISDESGNFLYLGLKVFSFEGTEVTDSVQYGYTGPAADCFEVVYYPGTEIPKNAPLGAIIFRNGGVDIEDTEVIDDRGDINLNGIAYEIADAVVFTNYFIEGLSAFTFNIDGQIAATEINGDGYTLTVADLVYLIRVIVGDALPLPMMKTNPNAFATFTSRGDVISVDANVELGAALFVFDGQITPTLASDASYMELKYGYVDNTTRVLVYSMEKGLSITSGEILHVDGNASLIQVEAAEYRGTSVQTTNKVLPTEFALHQNYPNPFNPTTTIKLELPTATRWAISVFDIQGRTVAEFDGYSEAGTVTVDWDASGMASGMYFFRADAGTFKATKKMILLK